MQTNRHVISAVLAAAVLLSGCGQASAGTGSEQDSASEPVISLAAPQALSFEISLPEKQVSTFRIQSDTADGVSYDQEKNIYTIVAAGEYDCSGDLFEGQLAVAADEDAEVILNLNGCLITNSTAAPVSLLTADKVEISAKKGSENKIYDLRTAQEGEDPGGGAVYAECDLTLKGNGSLEIISNYNNGVHTKDDLKIKNLTLSVKAPNNALRGNDSIRIESGSVTAVSSGGDAMKTSSTDLNKKGEQRGNVEISGGVVRLYAACDGIDSACDVTVSGDAVLEIYTDEYSPYSADYAAAESSTLYLRLDQSLYEAGYQYSAYFYNADGSGTWVDAVLEREAAPAMGGGNGGFDRGMAPGGADGENPPARTDAQPPAMPENAPGANMRGGGRPADGAPEGAALPERGGMKGGFGGAMPPDGGGEGANTDKMPGGGFDRGMAPGGADGENAGGAGFERGNKGGFAAAVCYYAIERPAGYANVRFYAYTSAQAQGQDQDYAAASEEDAVIPEDWDTCILTSVSGKTLASAGWTAYRSNSGKTDLEGSCKGIKAANSITLSGGTVTIRSKDDGLHANFDETLESTGKNGLGNILISGGTLTVSSGDDGIHADQDLSVTGGTVRVLTSYEGLEANRIYLSGGAVTVSAADDAVNANSKGAYAGYIEISGGFLDAAVPNGDTDTLDSNGTILISGGTVLLKNGQMSGSSRGGGTFDTARGVSVTGGTVIAVGCIGERPEGAAYSAAQTFESGEYTIQDSSGSTIAAFTLTEAYKGYIFSSESFARGQTYQVCRNGETAFSFTI